MFLEFAVADRNEMAGILLLFGNAIYIEKCGLAA